MTRGKIGKWMHENIVVVVCVPLLFGIQWGWTRLQDVPSDNKRDYHQHHLVSAFRKFNDMTINRLLNMRETGVGGLWGNQQSKSRED